MTSTQQHAPVAAQATNERYDDESPDANERIINVQPDALREMLARDEVMLLDVREDYERRTARIAGSTHCPLSSFDPATIDLDNDDKRIVFQCRTGRRSLDAAKQFVASRGGPVWHLAGGLEAWQASGYDIEKDENAPPIDIMRQVQLAAGSLVLLGVALGVLLSPWMLIISGFVGAGLVFAGATGWCGMAKVLSIMPWN